MANRLQKKLHELETEFANIIRLPLDPTSTNPRHQAAFDDIRKRFIFINNLLIREIASQSPENAEELREIGGRLTALEAAFRGWNDLRMSVCSNCSQALLRRGGDGGTALESDSPEKKKGCADQVVSNDDVGESSSDSTPYVSGGKTKDEAVRKEEATAVGDGDGARGKTRKYGGVFGCGMIAGAVCIQILFFVSYHYLDENRALLLPPT